MNNFIEELSNIVKLPFNEISKDFKIICVSNKILYISNFIKILDYTNEKIIIKVKKNQNVEVFGCDLCIGQINKKELVIKGNIENLDFGVHNEKNK